MERANGNGQTGGGGEGNLLSMDTTFPFVGSTPRTHVGSAARVLVP